MYHIPNPNLTNSNPNGLTLTLTLILTLTLTLPVLLFCVQYVISRVHGTHSHRTLFDYTRGEDPSRPVTFVCGRDYNVDKVVCRIHIALSSLLYQLQGSI